MFQKISIILLLLSIQACYSLNGISIPDNVTTYYVENFDFEADNAPPLINQTFTENLKTKINQQTRLVSNTETPDVEFKGSVTLFKVDALAPSAMQASTLNRLRISVRVEYINNQDEEASWTQTFTQNYDFSADAELLSIQDAAVEEMFEQMIEEIFNKSFANW